MNIKVLQEYVQQCEKEGTVPTWEGLKEYDLKPKTEVKWNRLKDMCKKAVNQ